MSKKKFIRGVIKVFGRLPLSVHYFNAHIIGWIARVVVHYRSKVVKANIDASFPELSEKERKKIYKGFYLHFGQIVCETVWFGASKGKRLYRSNIVNVVNPEETARLASLDTKGTIVMCAHVGNWEVYGGFPFYNHKDANYVLNYDNTGVVYRRVKDPEWDKVFAENRLNCCEKEYNNYVESAGILRHILQNMDKKIFYFMISDQWPYFKAPSYINVNFMGQNTVTMSGGAVVAHKYGMAVSYLSVTRRNNSKKYDYEFKPICDNAKDMSVQEIMDRYYKLIEDDIRKDPANYLWSHKRWKNLR